MVVAEAEEGIVVVPDILEVVEVELEITIRVSVHVRHPMVAAGIPHQQCTTRRLFHQEEHQLPFEFYSESRIHLFLLADTSHRLI